MIAAVARMTALAGMVVCGVINCVNSILVAGYAQSHTPLAVLGTIPVLQSTAQAFIGRLNLPQEAQLQAALAIESLERESSPAAALRVRAALAKLPHDAQWAADTARAKLAANDPAGALPLALRAGDFAVADRAITALEQRGDYAAAQAAVTVLLQATEHVPTAREAYAQGLWHAARLANYAADHATTTTDRLRNRQGALAFVERQLRLTPLSGQALLTAGYAALDLQQAARARRYFERARVSDPASASALVGLARVALVLHDLPTARVYAQHAYALAPTQGDVVRLRADV